MAQRAQFYCDRLEEEGRFQLFLWPYHCLIGNEGQAVVGVQEARFFHAFVLGAPSRIAIKGDSPLTENYSALSPEVLERHDGGTLARRNDRLIERLLGADALVVAGQAASHCVRSTVEDLVSEIASRADCRTKIYLLEDCMSSVVIRDPANPESKLFDFTPHFEQAKRAWREAGVHIVSSTEPMSSWPDF